MALKFQKMWEGANMFVYDIDTGTIIPTLKNLPQVASYADEYFAYYFDGKIGSAYYEKTELKRVAESGFFDFLNKDYQKKYFSGVDNIMKNTSDFIKKISELDLKQEESDKLKNLLIEGVNLAFQIFGYYAACQQQRTQKIEGYIKKEIEKTYPKSQTEEIFQILSTSKELTPVRKEEIDLLTIALEAKISESKSDINKKIAEHHRKYRLLGAADGNKAYEIDYFAKRINQFAELKIEDLKEKIEFLKTFAKKLAKEKEEKIKGNKTAENIVDLCGILAKLGHQRLEMRVSGFIPLYYYNERILEEIGIRKGYSPKLVRFLSWQEILEILNGKKVSRKILRERKNKFLLFLENGKVKIYSGIEAKNKFEEIIGSKDYSSQKEVKGNVAMKGKIRGNVLLFKWGDNIESKLDLIKKGDILVTGQTRPQIMPLILKSSAIVTDEGGVISHAAIVSRELKIPCVIGTKIATEVFKDGDYIEVNADIGIIKLLKR